MSGASFSWNLEPLERAIGSAVSHMGRTQELMEIIGEGLVAGCHERFDRQEDPEGVPWPPSVRATEEGGQTLRDTSRLRNSVGYEAGPDFVAYGTNDERAAIHQFGGTITPKKAPKLKFKVGGKFVQTDEVTMPARAFIGVSEDDMKMARDATHDFIAEAFNP